MSFNLLKEAKYIRNSQLCLYDSTHGYTTNFSVNGNVDGWTIYNNIYMYGCWRGVLFGSTYLANCFVGRSTVFLSVVADVYRFVEFMMMVEDNNPNRAVVGLTKGKVQWKRTDDSDWSDDRSMVFEIKETNSWQYYKLNLGPAPQWQGEINDLRFFPFLDARAGDKFFIKYIRVTSEDAWSCSNTQCSFYQLYSHPCQGVGTPAYCETTVVKNRYTTFSGINSVLKIDIDGYGEESFDLGQHLNTSGADMARIIGNKVSTLNIGGYSFVDIFYTDNNTLRISSGTNNVGSSVVIPYTLAAEELGFYDKDKNFIAVVGGGQDPATRFTYASTRQLQTFELNSITDGSLQTSYTHNPNQFSVEAGRRDFNEVGTSVLLSTLDDSSGYISFNGEGKTTIDLAHRVDNNGKLTHLWAYGVALTGAKFKIFSPHNDGGFTLKASINIAPQNSSMLYTKLPVVSRADCSILVNKGDLIGVYNVDLYVGKSLTGLPDATFCQYDGDVIGRLGKAKVFSYGVGGFAMYARGDLAQNSTTLDIDLGSRTNISEFRIFGAEKSAIFEFNLASCLDVSWNVDLFGGTHWHEGRYKSTGWSWTQEHTNVAYGIPCLNDCVITADNGQAGDTHSNSSTTGLATFGADHSYFYVNGDTEWGYDIDCSHIAEFCGDMWLTSTWDFERDPVAFTLYFPNNTSFNVHKTVIYFKEQKNFRNLTLSTFTDPYYTFGRADDPRFDLVKAYNRVYLNGTMYNPGDNENVDRYVFTNPMTDDLYNFSSQANNAALLSSVDVNWFILGHEFDPVYCKGMRLYTNKHSSTKIMEIEVYSKTHNDASLVDNALLYFSDYGDLWRTVGFNTRKDGVYAYIGATPRYLRLTLESQSEFFVEEIDITVTEQVYVDNPVILLEDSKEFAVGAGKLVEIVNTYDRPFDLTVSIPEGVSAAQNIICWNKLGSEDERQHPEVGPVPIYYKSADFPITMYHGQCAINVPSYGLQNLVDGKKAYYSLNGITWKLYGTLTKGTSLAVYNNYYFGAYSYSFTFNTVSNRYWKPQFLNVGAVYKVRDVVPYFDTTRLTNVLNVYYSSPPYASAQGTKFLSSGIDMAGSYVFHDDFEDGVIGNGWSVVLPGVISSTESLGKLTLACSVVAQPFSITSPLFPNASSFEFSCSFSITPRPNGEYWMPPYDMDYSYLDFAFYNNSTEVIRFRFYHPHLFSMSYNPWVPVSVYSRGTKISDDTTSVSTSVLLLNSTNNLKLLVSDTCLSLYINDVIIPVKKLSDGIFYNYFVKDSTLINKFKITCGGQALKSLILYDVGVKNAVALISPLSTMGLEMTDSTPINGFKFVLECSSDFNVDMYSSFNNLSNYLVMSPTLTHVKTLLYYRFLIDLVLRHDLDIIRNYGTLTNNISLSKDNGSVVFSDGTTPNMELDTFSSTYNDCRYMCIKMLSSTFVLQSVDTLGVYPDIGTVYCVGGGYNHNWDSFNTLLTSFSEPYNVAFGADVTATTTYYDGYAPENAVDGISSEYDPNKCWGFKAGTTPTLYIDFGSVVTVGSVVFYGGYNPNTSEAMNTGYTLSFDNTASGTNYVQSLKLTNLNTNQRLAYSFSPVQARRAKLVVDGFTGMSVSELQSDGFYRIVSIGFLREIEIYTADSITEINSQDYPVVCINLKDNFEIIDHSLSTTKATTIGAYWNNDDSFFKYSDFVFDDPRKIIYSPNNPYVVEYYSAVATVDLIGTWSYTFGTMIYLPQGNHLVSWDAYYPQNVNEISLVLSGDEEITLYATLYGVGWISQNNSFFVKESGYFTLVVKQNQDSNNHWGARTPKIYRSYGLTRWVAVTRNTATGYAYDDSAVNKVIGYLGKVKLFGSGKYIPTERCWWWNSLISTLSDDYSRTKVGRSSLLISYPASVLPDTVKIIKGDLFGLDIFWSTYDLFCFWLYIEDVSALDTTFGDVTLGAFSGGSNDFYYRWVISDLQLVTGWNYINLKFNIYSEVYPYNKESSKFLSKNLDIKHTTREFDTFYFRFRGLGTKPLSMSLDNLNIRRNVYDTDTRFGKGLCLTGFDHMVIPLSNATLNKGSVECWLNMGVDSVARDIFGNLYASTIFTLNNNNNDIIALRIKPASWFEVIAGNLRKQSLFNLPSIPEGGFIKLGQNVHVGLVWSNDGTGMDNTDTIRLYVNNQLRLVSDSTWEIGDTKLSYFKLGGGITQSDRIFESYSSFVYDNVKVYNYCKSSFNINQEGISGDYISSPEKFIEISKDGVSFYGIGAAELPFTFEQVPSGNAVQLYIRSNKTLEFSSGNSTAQILIEWLTTV